MKRAEINSVLTKIAEGDERAFESLFEETKGGVYSFVYSYMKNREDSEDVVQTVYLKIKQNIDKFESSGSGLAWILQIAKNAAITELRRRKIYDNYVELSNIADKVTTEPEDEGEVTAVMRRCLTDEEQRIILLHVIWGYKHREIAELLDMPTGSVTSKYKRAVDKIKTNLKKEA